MNIDNFGTINEKALTLIGVQVVAFLQTVKDEELTGFMRGFLLTTVQTAIQSSRLLAPKDLGGMAQEVLGQKNPSTDTQI